VRGIGHTTVTAQVSALLPLLVQTWLDDLSDEPIRSRKLEKAKSTLDSSSSLVLSETTSPLIPFLHSFELISNAH
jgi:hypothetical protein